MDIPWPPFAEATGGKPMRTRTRRVAMLLCVTTVLALPAAAQVDQQRAQEYFKDVQAVCEREGKRLWGMSLCGPMVIHDSRTQTFATSQPAPEGPRPRLLGLNAPIQWGGVTWAAYMWDTLVNAPPLHAKEILLHELFHGIVQRKLGLAASEMLNEHLDAMDGRYWLRLECRALARALRESGAQRNTAVRDALAFRQARRMLYQGSAEKERALGDQRRRRLVHGRRGRGGVGGRRGHACDRDPYRLPGRRQFRSHVRVPDWTRIWPPARWAFSRLASADPRHRRFRRASGRRAPSFNQPPTPRRPPPDTAAPRSAPPRSGASKGGRNASPNCAGSSWTVRCS